MIIDGLRRDFRYPTRGNQEAHVLRILNGDEYSRPPLPGWAPDLVLDIGANIGAAALYFSLLYPTAELHCWEPAAENFEYLQRNLGWLARASLYRYGLSDSPGSVRLYHGCEQSMQHSLAVSVETQAERWEDIRMERASQHIRLLVDQAGPSPSVVLKIDTEGCEVPILSDLCTLLRHVDLLFVEYHSEKDRRQIDRIVESHHLLLRSEAQMLHRGNVTYISNRLVAAYPKLGHLEIRV